MPFFDTSFCVACALDLFPLTRARVPHGLAGLDPIRLQRAASYIFHVLTFLRSSKGRCRPSIKS